MMKSEIFKALQKLKDVNKMIKETGNVSERLKEAARNAKDETSKELLHELSGEFAKGISEAQKGNVYSLNNFIKKAENIAKNGN